MALYTTRLSSLSYDHGYNDYARLVIGRDEKSVANPFVSGNKGVMRGNFSISISWICCMERQREIYLITS